MRRCGEEVRHADELGHEAALRRVEQLLRRRHLLYPAVVHHRYLVAHEERLILVMRDEHCRRPGGAQDKPHVGPHLGPQAGVQVGERLVQQQHLRLGSKGTRQRHTLLLAAGELMRIARLEAAQADEGADLLQTSLPLAPPRQPEGDVLGHGQVREQSVVLEHHPHPPLLGRQGDPRAGDKPAADLDRAAVGPLEAGDEPQRRRLAATAGAEQRQQMASFDAKVEPRHRPGGAIVFPQAEAADRDLAHRLSVAPGT